MTPAMEYAIEAVKQIDITLHVFATPDEIKRSITNALAMAYLTGRLDQANDLKASMTEGIGDPRDEL